MEMPAPMTGAGRRFKALSAGNHISLYLPPFQTYQT